MPAIHIPRNLTTERQLAFLERQKQAAMNAVSPTETAMVAVAKRDKAGQPVIDADGVPVIVEKRVLKRAFIEAEHIERIAAFKAGRGLK
jgi:uncharacterized metal-binding protein